MSTLFLSKEEFLNHWQGHRNLTRRVIEAFPENDLFNFSIGGMRTFAAMTQELLAIAGPGLKSIAENETSAYQAPEEITTKEALLQKWDEDTAVINHYYESLDPARFGEKFSLFGAYDNSIKDNLLYFIDNEMHHRGQGYVYLRALGIVPPFFWER